VKRVAAAIIAIALVVAGFVINGRRTDPERGKAPLRLWCVKDAEQACNALATDRLIVTIGSPLDVDNADTAEKFDAVVTSAPWLDRLDAPNLLKTSAALAASSLVVATRTGNPKSAEMSVLINPDSRIAFPPPGTLAASVAATNVGKGGTFDELTESQVVYLSQGGARITEDALVTVTQTSLIDGAIVLEANTKNLSVTSTLVSPKAVLQLEIGYLIEDARLDKVRDGIRSELLREGWQEPYDIAPGPAGQETVRAFTALNT
jgi:Bacterial extracellular solute-binding protein